MIFFTSDLHLGHNLVSELRGFDNTDAHDLTIATNWTNTIRNDDIVWVLGDLTMTQTTHALDLIRELPGRKRLIVGNHDPVHPMHSRSVRHFSEWADVFEFIAPFARIKLCGRETLLSHFPYESDRTGLASRYMQYRLRNEGLPLLHGHTHSDQRWTSEIESHVGLDAWDMTPVPDHILARRGDGGV